MTCKILKQVIFMVSFFILSSAHQLASAWQAPYYFTDGIVSQHTRGGYNDFNLYYIDGMPIRGKCSAQQSPDYCSAYSFSLPLAFWGGNTHTITADGGFPPPQNFSEPKPSYTHMQYFGYWYSTYKDGGGNSTVTGEVANHANTAVVFAFVIPGADPWQSTRELLNEVRSRGMKAILSIPVWGAYGDGNLYNCPLNSDWTQRLTSWSAAITPYVNDGTIVAFLSIDEPRGSCVAAASTVISYVKPLLPTVPIWTNMGEADVEGAWPIGTDWISFDQYGQDFSVIKNRFAGMKARLAPGQRTVLITEATNYAVPADDYLLASIADDYLNLARDTSVIAVIPFMWRPNNLIGVSNLPITKARYTTFGQSFVGQ
jgi:hypothetical protein